MDNHSSGPFDAERRGTTASLIGTAPVTWQDPSSDRGQPMNVGEVISSIDRRLSQTKQTAFDMIPTGFTPLDESIGGGLHLGSLFLLAGAHGTGKTTFALQLARNVAATEDNVVALYICFEHDETHLLTRLIAMEAKQSNSVVRTSLTMREVQSLLAAGPRRGYQTIGELAVADRRLGESLGRVSAYQDSLFLRQAIGRTQTISTISTMVNRLRQHAGKNVVLVVDYLQKVPAEKEFATEGERITWVVEGLKDMALRQRIAVVAIAALDSDGLQAQRLHAYHLWGGSSLAYEADMILMLAEKSELVSRVNFEFNPQKIIGFREWVVASLVKNRFGRNMIDMEFQKQFAHSCFDPLGGIVAEKLVDERVYRE
jgi:replicative DNA helicase